MKRKISAAGRKRIIAANEKEVGSIPSRAQGFDHEFP
jgi:hypothetical protein